MNAKAHAEREKALAVQVASAIAETILPKLLSFSDGDKVVQAVASVLKRNRIEILDAALDLVGRSAGKATAYRDIKKLKEEFETHG